MRVPETPPLPTHARAGFSFAVVTRSRPKSFRKGEMIEFLAQMPTDTIFLTMAVLGLAAMLIVLRRRDGRPKADALVNAQIAAGYALTLRLRGSVNVRESESPRPGGSILDRGLRPKTTAEGGS